MYGGDQEEDEEEEEEEVMAAVCHSCKTYSVTQPKSVDEACSQQLNQ